MNPRKIFLYTSLFALFFTYRARAQRPIEVSYVQDQKGNYNFSAFSKAYCPYLLRLVFTSLQNGKVDHELPFEAVVRPGANPLFKLSLVNPSQDIEFKYSISFRKGGYAASPVMDFPYVLPVAAGKETQAYLTETKAGDGWSQYAVRLRMKPGDTIFAARRGIVTGVDVSSAENDAGQTSTGSWNAIEIFQMDSSFAEYGVVKKEGALVRPGQVVEAGQPIGLVGGDAFGRGSEARISVYFYQGNTRLYVPLQFWTKRNGKGLLKHGGEYTSEYPPPILRQEQKTVKPAARKPVKPRPRH